MCFGSEKEYFGIFKVYLGCVHFNKASSQGQKHFGFSQDLHSTKRNKFELDAFDLEGETLRVELQGIQVDADVDCTITLFNFFTLKFTKFTISNLGFEMLLGGEALSGNGWKLLQLNDISFEPKDINFIWTDSTLSNQLIPSPKQYVQTNLNFLGILPFLETYLDSWVIDPVNQWISQVIRDNEQ